MAKSELSRLRPILEKREASLLSAYAVASAEGCRRRSENRLEQDYRQAFAVDVDRILHSLAYTRYIDKTQVFYLIENDHITHRMLHVQLVSKVARTIGRFLGLNEDLIEAIAIGHDIGHPPFGHDGERCLSRLCRDSGIGEFHHNVQSVHFLDFVEKKGSGWNLCLQTLDGILCHDGEIHDQVIRPLRGKDFAAHTREMAARQAGEDVELVPMTLEGCVVRFADTVSYIGRDIEDAIRLGIISRSRLPKESVRELGSTNGTIVYTLVTDIIENSLGKEEIAFSRAVSEALQELKTFNYSQIYINPMIKKNLPAIERLYKELFYRFTADIRNKRLDSPIYAKFIDGMAPDYLDCRHPEEVVRDFISGMTDKYFLRQAPEELRPAVCTD
ncbi:MAG: HD domain-containing protein [Desulfosalsimonadaceae bacterium]